MDFAPLVKDISKTDQITKPSEGLSSDSYPIQVYEPLVPVSQKDLETLRLAYWQELKLLPHPIFDLYFLQIYHAQATVLGKRRELLSVGLATYKTIKIWQHRLFGHVVNEYDNELRIKNGVKETQIEDSSKELLRLLVTNYFRKEWKAILDDVTGLTAALALTVARAGSVGLDNVVIEVFTLYSVKLIAKGVKEREFAYVAAGFFLLLLVCLFSAPVATNSLIRLLSSPTPVVVIPKIIITVSDLPQATSTFLPTSTAIVETPTLSVIVAQSTSTPLDAGYCMYVVQPGDSIQSVASSFKVAESELRVYSAQVTSSLFVVNQMIEVNAPCCRPSGINGFSYTAQYSENLAGISEKFATTEEVIASVNNLFTPSYIQTGQMLCIPYP